MILYAIEEPRTDFTPRFAGGAERTPAWSCMNSLQVAELQNHYKQILSFFNNNTGDCFWARNNSFAIAQTAEFAEHVEQFIMF